MSNPIPSGSSGGRPSANPPNPGPSARRSSYASVLSGTTNTNNPPATSSNPRAGFMSHASADSASAAGPFSRSLPPQYSQLQSPAAQDILSSRHSIHNDPEVWDKAQLPSYTAITISGDGPGDNSMDLRPTESFVPSYLFDSKHLERLEERRRARVLAERNNNKSGRSSTAGSLSTRTSSSNLHKMIPSHRGMTHEIIERPFHQAEDCVAPLPSRWSGTDKFAGLEVLGDGTEIKFSGSAKASSDEGAAVRADHPMPRECGIYYFEITVLSKGKDSQIAVGFSGPKVVMHRLPGWEIDSWAYHGDDGNSYCSTPQGRQYGQKFGHTDVIGCGVNFRTQTAFFTRNGNHLGTAFRDIRHGNLFPSVGVKKLGEHIRVNFGQSPFVFDIDGMVRDEKLNLQREIQQQDASRLHPSQNESLLAQGLIAQYLAHDGFIETAKAFSEEVRNGSRLLTGVDKAPRELDYKEDLDAINRQKIRTSILDGNVDKALKLTNAFYPAVLAENENIYFKLRCRKFIEMIRRSTELQVSSAGRGVQRRSSSSVGKMATNGHHDGSAGDDGVFDGADMELDDAPADEMAVEAGADGMDIEESDLHSRQNDLTGEALRYGQELQSEFKDDPRREVKQALEDTFALIAYPDARESSLAPLLETAGRIPVAEELNSAILVSLGKSSHAVLERLYQQSEVLITELAQSGGDGAALINVRRDYLQR